MANPLLDLQDEFDSGMAALRGLLQLLYDAGGSGRDFEAVRPEELAVLVSMVESRFRGVHSSFVALLPQLRTT